MFESDNLKNHLLTSHTIETESAVFAEWNLNQLENINKVGNYRFRPNSSTNGTDYSNIVATYDPLDVGNYYTGATDADTVIDSGYDDNDTPQLVISQKENIKLIYSLEDCLKPNRPRSGINKLLYLGIPGAQYGYNQYIDDLNRYVARRPRYYMSSKYDQFKYWSSFRTEYGLPDIPNEQVYQEIERGISKSSTNGVYYIDDAAPFVVYNENVPANRIVVKMQTNVGEEDLGPFRFGNENFSDPLYGDINKTVPVRWKVQVLKENNWVSIIEFDEDSTRKDGSAIIKSDGYVEVAYGLQIPEQYENIFVFAEELISETQLPDTAPIGYSYLIKENDDDRGTFYIYTGNDINESFPGWETFVPNYNWEIFDESIESKSRIIKKLTNPEKFIENNANVFREIDLIRGIRIVVETMNLPNSTFDLIEMSPRIFANISDKVVSFSATKTLSDLGNGSIPVGSLIASTGNIELFDDEFFFSEQNVFNEKTGTGSIVSKYFDTNVKFLFYDIVKNVGNYDYFIPIKSLYSSGMPQSSDNAASAQLDLRDFYYYFESSKAPQMLLTDVSLSYAITVLLDAIGFSNYIFKRVDGEKEFVIPYFFVAPDQNIAEILQQLAIASQSAMFFDEFNNFVVMSKDYILPSESNRSTDLVLYGQEESNNIPNIINLSSVQKKVYNNGQLNYTTRYIQKTTGSIDQAMYTNADRNYKYKPVILWEVEGKEQRQSINELAANSSAYSMAAAPLNTNLSNQHPYVYRNKIYNNIIDLGENIYWVANYSGYFYANGEIIKYDAIEYFVENEGNVWITSNHEYQDYFGRLKFNGKMYPTGNVRIYAEPYYETVNGIDMLKNGEVKKSGRAQFGTQIINHSAGLSNDDHWTNNSYVRGCIQSAKDYLFTMNNDIEYPIDLSAGPAGLQKNINNVTHIANQYAEQSTRNGIMKNFLTNKNLTEKDVNYFQTTQAGSVQSSALIFNGPTTPSDIAPSEMVSYVYKELPRSFKHFGTRMRIVGKVEQGTNKSQTPSGGFSLIDNNLISSSNPTDVSIIGGSGGIAFGLNKDTNNGYYFEIVALANNNIDAYNGNSNSVYYTISRDPEVIVVNDSVVLTTVKQHALNVGDLIIVSGLIDNSRRLNSSTKINGEFTVSSISQDRKSIAYTIPAPTILTPAISSAIGDGTKITYTTSSDHDFKAGQIVDISGTNQAAFNITGAIIKNVPSKTAFTVESTGAIYTITDKEIDTGVATLTTQHPHSILVGQIVKISGVGIEFDGSYTVTETSFDTFSYNVDEDDVALTDVSSGNCAVIGTYSASSTGGTATYVPLTTIADNGGTVTKSSGGDLTISNIFFYKTLAGTNTSDVVRKQRLSNIVTLTTANKHKFVQKDRVVISGVDNTIDGEHQIDSVTDTTITFTSIGNNIESADLSIVGKADGSEKVAIPQILWSGLSNILVDDGKFTGQTRFSTTEQPTVYDLSAEYIDIGTNKRRFYLYINGKQIATVDDDAPLNMYQNVALFVRGSSRCMFENIYALTSNYGQNTTASLQLPISKVFGDTEVDVSESLRKYALNGFVQNTYLAGISSQSPPQYNIYFEEFGTIMREVAHFNIRYDRAYPALYAKLAETLNRVKGYSVSGFFAGSYGAEFLIFNCIDKNLNLDDTTGNYLRIHGIAFTQNTTYTLTADDYFDKMSNLADPELNEDKLLYSPGKYKKMYDDIKNSRIKYGMNEFSLDSPYIQTTAAAEEMFGWILSKVMVPRKAIGINTFATQNIQLGDIVSIDYKDTNGNEILTNIDTRYIVYNIEYKKDQNGPTTTLYLAEV